MRVHGYIHELEAWCRARRQRTAASPGLLPLWIAGRDRFSLRAKRAVNLVPDVGGDLIRTKERRSEMGGPELQQECCGLMHERRAILKTGVTSVFALSWFCSGIAVARGLEEPKARFLREWGRRGKADGEFNVPIGIAMTNDESLLVSDFRNGRLQKFSLEGKFLAAFEVGSNPSGLAVSTTGEIYVAHFGIDGHGDQISVHDPSGKRLRDWGRSGKADAEFDMPGGIAIDPDGQVYVADQTNRRIQVFDKNGKFLRKWGKHGTALGEFGGNTGITNRTGGPHFLAFDHRGELYATEASMGRIQVFTAEGKFLRAWGNNEDKPGGFGGRPKNLPGPIGICIDKQDRVWVSSTNNRVQQFSAEGGYLRGFGSKGQGPGEFSTPHAMAFDRAGFLYIVDTLNCRIQVFAV